MNSTYLEVGVGLAVVFFVVATVADGFNEIISRALNTRSKALWAALTGLLSDGSELKPDLGFGFVFKSILPSWLGGLDFRPRVNGHALGAIERAKLIEWIITGKDHVGADHKAAANRAFKQVSDQVGMSAQMQLRSRENRMRWWLEKADDEQLLAVAKDLVMEYGDVSILYPPLQEMAVRERLLSQYLAGTDPHNAEVANWIARLPLNEKAGYLADHLPITDDVMHVLSDGNDYEEARLAALDDDTARYRDHDPGLARTMALLRTRDGARLTEGYIEALRPDVPSAREMSEWLFPMPIRSQTELMQSATLTGEYLTAAARTAGLLHSASVSGLDYVRSRGRRTKVYWVDGKTFGSALWELAKERSPEAVAAGGLGAGVAGGEIESRDLVGVTEGVRQLAAEWRGTPLGNYLASTGIDRARSIDQFVNASGAWFDGQMDQLSLSYRRNVKWVLGFFGFFMALLFNLNAVGLTQALINDAEARATLDAYSQSILADACNSSSDGAGDVVESEDPAAAIVGGGSDACALGAAKVEDQLNVLRELDDLGVPLLSDDWKLWRGVPSLAELLGMVVTGVAVSFGGVFWYDFLKFLTGVRRKV